MSLLLDQNLSRHLVRLLVHDYPGLEHVAHAGLDTVDDAAVWQYAASRNLMIVSKDANFRHMAMLYGPPPKVVWLRIGNASTTVIATLLQTRATEIHEFAADPNLAMMTLP